MTKFRTLATVRHHGMALSDLEFTVPLDHGRRTARSSVFARGPAR
jgi:hypothetical protein